MKKIILLLIIFFLFIPVNGRCQTERAEMVRQCAFNGVDYQNAVRFVKLFQSLIKVDDQGKVARLFEYPLRVNFSHTTAQKYKIEHKYIQNEAQLIKNYNDIFTKALKLKLLSQAPEQIFCNYQGAMIANGGIWFAEKNKQLRIIAVNL